MKTLTLKMLLGLVGLTAFVGQAQAVEFPSLVEIFCNAKVRAALQGDWSSSSHDLRERSRWILWNADTGVYSFTAGRIGDENTVAAEARPADFGSTYWVGFYHTHPPLHADAPITPVGPSAQDKTKAAILKVPSLVRDFTDSDRFEVMDYLYGSYTRGAEVSDPVNDVSQLPAAVCN